MIKEAEKREAEEQKRHRAQEANRVIREVTAKDVYDRQLEGKYTENINNLCLNRKNLFFRITVSKRRQREREDKLQEEIDKLKRQRKNDQLASFDPTRLYQR